MAPASSGKMRKPRIFSAIHATTASLSAGWKPASSTSPGPMRRSAADSSAASMRLTAARATRWTTTRTSVALAAHGAHAPHRPHRAHDLVQLPQVAHLDQERDARQPVLGAEVAALDVDAGGGDLLADIRQQVLAVVAGDDDAGDEGLRLADVPRHLDPALRLHMVDVHAVRPVHGDA